MSQSPRTKFAIVTVAIIGGLLAVTALVANQSTKPQVVGDRIVETFSQGEPCATVDVALAPTTGSDPSASAKVLFDALRPNTGLNTATYNIRTNTLTVGYCESQLSESAVRGALAPTGLLAQ